MKYTEVLGTAFKSLKSPGLWGFFLTAYGAIGLVFGVVLGGAWLAGGSGTAALFADPAALEGTAPPAGFLTGFFIMWGAFSAAFLLSLPLLLIMHAGAVHLTNAYQSGGDASVGAGWGAGLKRMGRVLGIDFIAGLVPTLIMAVAFVPLVIVLLAAGGPDQSGAGAAAFGTFCCGLLIWMLVIMLVSLLYQGYEALAVRYGVIGDHTVGSALSSAWQAFKVSWKQVLVFSLMVLGIGYGWSMVTSIITTPLQLVVMPMESYSPNWEPTPQQMGRMFSLMPLLYIVSFLVTLPYYVFLYSAWTAFFRRLTGLDTPPMPPQAWSPAPTGYGYAPPAPGYPPAPPVAQPGYAPPSTPPTPPAPPVAQEAQPFTWDAPSPPAPPPADQPGPTPPAPPVE